VGLQVRRLADALGVEITGVDLSQPISDEVFEDILAAWYEGLVAVFPGQALDTEQQAAFARRFGELELVRTIADERGGQTVMYVSNRPVEGFKGVLPKGEMQFHADQCYYEIPCMATFLYGIKIPARGGNTLFANGYRAYESLSPATKDKIERRTAHQVYDYDGSGTVRSDSHRADAPSFEHPIVVRHPVTTKPALFVNRLMTDHIVGMDRAEGTAMLEELFCAIEASDNIYEHTWTPGDLVLWDNRCTLHARTDFDPSEPRTLRRLTVKGTRPVAAFAPSASASASGRTP